MLKIPWMKHVDNEEALIKMNPKGTLIIRIRYLGGHIEKESLENLTLSILIAKRKDSVK